MFNKRQKNTKGRKKEEISEILAKPSERKLINRTWLLVEKKQENVQKRIGLSNRIEDLGQKLPDFLWSLVQSESGNSAWKNKPRR